MSLRIVTIFFYLWVTDIDRHTRNLQKIRIPVMAEDTKCEI